MIFPINVAFREIFPEAERLHLMMLLLFYSHCTRLSYFVPMKLKIYHFLSKYFPENNRQITRFFAEKIKRR